MKNYETIIRCIDCPLMEISGYARITAANYSKRPRGNCFCKHPDAERVFKEYCPNSPRMPCFISFTQTDSGKPDIKTSPRWCPLKHMGAVRQ